MRKNFLWAMLPIILGSPAYASHSHPHPEVETSESWHEPVKADFSVHNCFSPFGLPDDIGDSVVEIVSRLKSHSAVTGTGSIIADSGDAQNDENHILTAKHVIQDAWEIDIVLSDGTFIGKAVPLAQTHEHLTHDQDGGIVGSNDLAVLVIDSFASPATEARYRSIKGLSLSTTRPSGLLEGVFQTPGGIQHGTSGAPVLSTTGQVVAVITQSFLGRTFAGVPDIEADGTNEEWFSDKNRFGTIHEKVSIPRKAEAVADPVISQSVIYSLGLSGVNFNMAPYSGDVIVPGYPSRTCLVYKGNIHSQ